MEIRGFGKAQVQGARVSTGVTEAQCVDLGIAWVGRYVGRVQSAMWAGERREGTRHGGATGCLKVGFGRCLASCLAATASALDCAGDWAARHHGRGFPSGMRQRSRTAAVLVESGARSSSSNALPGWLAWDDPGKHRIAQPDASFAMTPFMRPDPPLLADSSTGMPDLGPLPVTLTLTLLRSTCPCPWSLSPGVKNAFKSPRSPTLQLIRLSSQLKAHAKDAAPAPRV
eukprot:364837-Chlamydomonas_euryale.AAC.8